MQQIHATNNGYLLGLVTEREISVSNTSVAVRIVLPIGRRHSLVADARSQSVMAGTQHKPKFLRTLHSSQSSAIPIHPITWLLWLLVVMVGSLARTKPRTLSDCYSYLFTEYGTL
jgi:hypothetical protein